MSLEDVSVDAGRYIVAVSGGVDSVTLLDLLARNSKLNLDLIVAHVDHGIRENSDEDAKFVAGLAEKYGLSFETTSLGLGAGASEARAREGRYKFLLELCNKHNARLITAHHQDDLIETAILNILRGTGPHGLVGMLGNKRIVRPFLAVSKTQILDFARKYKLKWHEDSTNLDQSYLRNYVRLQIMPKLNSKRGSLADLITQTSEVLAEADSIIHELLTAAEDNGEYKRGKLLELDFQTLCYVVRQMLFDKEVSNINRKTITRVALGVKTLPVGKTLDIDLTHKLVSKKEFVLITTTN